MEHRSALSEKLKQTNLLSSEEIDFICSRFQQETLQKNECFLQSGNRCSRIGFLEDGILVTYIYSQEGEEVVKYFVELNQFFTDLDSYEQKSSAVLNIQAVVESTVLSISRADNEIIQSKLPQWDSILKSFAAEALNKMIRNQNFLHFGTDEDQYAHFVQQHPNLVRHVPLKYIASYLGVTQSSLSRIRRGK